MKAMILAAGSGTRLRPLTHDLPKPMLPLLGKPVLEYLIEHLASAGIKQIMINTSHMAPAIEQYFGHGQRLGVQIGYSFEGHIENNKIFPNPIGSAGGLRKIQDLGGFFDETTLVVCGDALIDLDVGAAMREHKQKRALVSLVVKEVPWQQVSSYGIVVSDDDGRITSFQEKPQRDEALSNWASTGIYIFEPEALDLIPFGLPFDIGGQLFPLLVAQGLPFYAQRRHFNWLDISNVYDYWSATQRALRGEIADLRPPGAEIRKGVWAGLNTRIEWEDTEITGPVYIGPGAHIEAGCRIIGPTWIGHGCRLEAGVQITRSILFEYTRIAAGARLDEVIVSGNYCVSNTGDNIEPAGAVRPWSDARAREHAASQVNSLK
ncbi:MAG: NDP-sugar synthase [Gammaproteobacteria bacterium]|nr:NDP-sugar synthase [Gammaproteobacteria bacterium]